MGGAVDMIFVTYTVTNH